MRLLLTLSALALLASACADDVDTEAGVDSTSSTTVVTTTSLATSSTLPPPSSTVVSPTVPTTTTEPLFWPSTIGAGVTVPRVLLAEGTDVTEYRVNADGLVERNLVYETEHPATHLRQSSEGYLFAREREETTEGEPAVEFVRYHFDAGRDVLDVEWIFDVAVVNGVESVIVAVPSPDGYGFGGVEAWAVDDLAVVADLGLAAEAEFGVTDFHWSEAAEIGVASAWSDLTEWVGFVDTGGDPVELPSPTDDLQYNSPPYVSGATISPDGDTLYWVEGPDWGFDPATGDAGPIESEWVLYGADLVTGDVTLVWPLSEPVLDFTVLDVHSVVAFGDFILVNRTTMPADTTTLGAESVALAPLVLDLSGEEPELFEFPAVGIAAAWAI